MKNKLLLLPKLEVWFSFNDASWSTVWNPLLLHLWNQCALSRNLFQVRWAWPCAFPAPFPEMEALLPLVVVLPLSICRRWWGCPREAVSAQSSPRRVSSVPFPSMGDGVHSPDLVPSMGSQAGCLLLSYDQCSRWMRTAEPSQFPQSWCPQPQPCRSPE